MQTVTRNALADPYVLGVSSGASTGAVFAIICGGFLYWEPTIHHYSQH